ncbi:hypothetical protein FE392_04030 [Xenorhabdus sp. 12]|uniref:Uncharacterized protein n=1 Tax=Xenorhabdus santafensis TaxID=2582833 RepID=A0ABU4S7H5_9GAMM|nr:hypothetical protein [Xenorhabdus sp. 12]MDX7986505.1 hypothetical protein [Xenorhabdus sp. 12]
MFNIKNKKLRNQAILPVMFMIVFGFLALLSIATSIFKGNFGGILLSAFFSVFFIIGFAGLNKVKKFDDLMSKKTLANYLKNNELNDMDKISCSNCSSKKISNRNHTTKVFREFYCSVCGETLYYVERKDFI